MVFVTHLSFFDYNSSLLSGIMPEMLGNGTGSAQQLDMFQQEAFVILLSGKMRNCVNIKLHMSTKKLRPSDVLITKPQCSPETTMVYFQLLALMLPILIRNDDHIKGESD